MKYLRKPYAVEGRQCSRRIVAGTGRGRDTRSPSNDLFGRRGFEHFPENQWKYND